MVQKYKYQRVEALLAALRYSVYYSIYLLAGTKLRILTRGDLLAAHRYSVYLLVVVQTYKYWRAESHLAAYAQRFDGSAHEHGSLAQLQHTGTQFTCFTGTKVQMLTARGAACSCCSSNNIASAFVLLYQ